MRHQTSVGWSLPVVTLLSMAFGAGPAAGQLIDQTQASNAAREGIAKSLEQQVGPGRGDLGTPGTSLYLIARDPFRSIRRGRQVFQRKFTRLQGQGPAHDDGFGDIGSDNAVGAGLADSCAACHGRPRGSAGAGGDVVTRPDSRDAPHLFGLGLKEMLADEMTADLRSIRDETAHDAAERNCTVTEELVSKGISFGSISVQPDGTVDTSAVEGVDPDLRVRPFFAQGGLFSMREFLVGALNNEMGLQAADRDLAVAAGGGVVVTPSGLRLDGSVDLIDPPPAASPTDDPDGDGVVSEVPVSIVDHLEFYLLNYFKPATGRQTAETRRGRDLLVDLRCTECHVPSLRIDRDRRVADVSTVFDPSKGIFNRLFATATARLVEVDDGSGLPTVKRPSMGSFVVRNIYTDLKRHDLGAAFHERNYDGSIQTEFVTTPLWGVGSTGPYGHDGRSISLEEVILRHGGEAKRSRDRFEALKSGDRARVIAFLNSLILFPPDDTASNLDPGDPSTLGFPQFGHGSIKLGVLFNDPSDKE